MVIVDDVLATGGTAAGAVDLATKAGARVQAITFVIELEALQGRARAAQRGGAFAGEVVGGRLWVGRFVGAHSVRGCPISP